MYFWQIENFAYGEINERSFSNPHPCEVNIMVADNHPVILSARS